MCRGLIGPWEALLPPFVHGGAIPLAARLLQVRPNVPPMTASRSTECASAHCASARWCWQVITLTLFKGVQGGALSSAGVAIICGDAHSAVLRFPAKLNGYRFAFAAPQRGWLIARRASNQDRCGYSLVGASRAWWRCRSRAWSGSILSNNSRREVVRHIHR